MFCIHLFVFSRLRDFTNLTCMYLCWCEMLDTCVDTVSQHRFFTVFEHVRAITRQFHWARTESHTSARELERQVHVNCTDYRPGDVTSHNAR